MDGCDVMGFVSFVFYSYQIHSMSFSYLLGLFNILAIKGVNVQTRIVAQQ